MAGWSPQIRGGVSVKSLWHRITLHVGLPIDRAVKKAPARR
jgi:hypothetical protein